MSTKITFNARNSGRTTKSAVTVTPAKAGVQKLSENLDSGFRRNDDQVVMQAHLFSSFVVPAISGYELLRWRKELEHEAVFVKAKVCRKEIFYLNSIIEAYDGLALMSTLDAAEGLIGFCVPEEQLGDLLELLDNLAQDILIEFSVIQSMESIRSIRSGFLKRAELEDDSRG